VSLLSWITVLLLAFLVLFHFLETGDVRFLAFAIPGLAVMALIPHLLHWMNRKSYEEARIAYEAQARYYPLRDVTPDIIGKAARVRGIVQRKHFQWMKRPHYVIKDNGSQLRVVIFTMPSEKITVGDRIEATGIVMKNLFRRQQVVLSAVSITKAA